MMEFRLKSFAEVKKRNVQEYEIVYLCKEGIAQGTLCSENQGEQKNSEKNFSKSSVGAC